MPYFICPRCAWRGSLTSRTAGFTTRPVGCEKCGFGFLFELMDDYFMSPLSGVLVCDKEGRILALGHGAFTLTGFHETELMGLDLEEALELRVVGNMDDHPHLTAIEWGARVLGKSMTMRVASGQVREVTGDFFPAYDEDGGLLAIFTPRSI